MFVKIVTYSWVAILAITLYDFTRTGIHELARAEAQEICHGYQDQNLAR